jgi:hypothetical protein
MSAVAGLRHAAAETQDNKDNQNDEKNRHKGLWSRSGELGNVENCVIIAQMPNCSFFAPAHCPANRSRQGVHVSSVDFPAFPGGDVELLLTRRVDQGHFQMHVR